MNLKKQLVLIGLSGISTMMLSAQVKKFKGFIITGQLQNAAHQMVYLVDGTNSDSKPYSDSITTDASGRFTFTGSIPEPRLFILRLSGFHVLKFYVENTRISLNGNADSLSKVNISGSKEDLVRQAFEKAREQQMETFAMEAMKPYLTAVGRKDSVAMRLEYDIYIKKTSDSLSSLVKRSVIQYPGSAWSVNLLEVLDSFNKLPLADSLLKIVETTPAGKYTSAVKLRQSINMVNGGAIAPDFSQPDTAGVAVALSGFKGKYMLLDFWASWCYPCRAENPTLVKAYEKYKGSNFTILSVSIDDNKASWLKAVQKDMLPWMQVSDLKGAANEAAKLYNVTAIPANFLIDPQGRIVASNLRGEDLINFLDKLL